MTRFTMMPFALACAAACGPPPQRIEEPDPEPAPVLTGSVGGRVCDERVGALVTAGTARVITANGDARAAALSEQGTFIVDEVPAGRHDVVVEGGSYWRVFHVEVRAQEHTELPGSETPCAPADPTVTGVITGRICLPGASGPEPVAGVRVAVTQPLDGIEIDDVTRPDGSFWLAVPAPQAGLSVSATLASSSYTWDGIDVSSTATAPGGTDLSAGGCTVLGVNEGSGTIVVTGLFDPIELELALLGVDVELMDGMPPDVTTLWTQDLFADFNALATRDTIFVASGVSEVDFDIGLSPGVVENLREWVEAGGSLYASGHTFRLIEAAWPEAIDFRGNDTDREQVERGAPSQIDARITEPALAAMVGADTLSFDVRLPGTPIALDVGDGSRAIVRGTIDVVNDDGGIDALDAVHVVAFSRGAGRVVYTTFHRESDAVNGTEELTDAQRSALRYLLFML